MSSAALPPLSTDPNGEAAARRILLVRAFDAAAADDPLWTPQDGGWATRLARETTPADATPIAFLHERARHALQRLLPRDAAASRALQRRLWRPAWLVAAVLAGALAGAGVDAIGGSQRINLLAPPVWAVIVWNAVVYVGLLWPLPRGLKAALARRLGGAPAGTPVLLAFHADWSRQAAPLTLARTALLLHAASAALALGLIAGMYLRGLVLDYRAGWQSTFLDAAQVRAALAAMLAPAAVLTGIAVPDAVALQALRVGPGAVPIASAAPWLHLYATTLALFVVVPRGALAAFAAWRARSLAARFPLALGAPDLQRLLREWRGEAAVVQVLPHGAAPSPSTLAGLRMLLAGVFGERLQLVVLPAVAHGAESELTAAPRGAALDVLLVDLATTPEDEAHGRVLPALGPVRLLLADESAWHARFAALPARVAERRAAWRRWADGHGLAFVGVDLLQPDQSAATTTLQAAIGQR